MRTYRYFLAALLAAVFILAAFPATGVKYPPSPDSAFADEDWKKEFEDVCSNTQDAMALTPDELRGFLERCDKLKTRIEALDETEKKVYLRRLKMCRDLFGFTLESKEAQQP